MSMPPDHDVSRRNLLRGLSAAALLPAALVSADEKLPAAKVGDPEKKLFRGRGVIVREALKRRGINSFEEFDDQVALETTDGRLLPIIPDWRGRAFFQDERLRHRDVELIGFERPLLPYLQVLQIYTFDEKRTRMQTDYWCDICAIPMYEIKPCDCCQAEIRLRFEPQDLPPDLQRDASALADFPAKP